MSQADEDIKELDVDYIPNSWVDENKIRHAYVWDNNIQIRYEFDEEGKLKEVAVF